jgi:hypothetical protein
MSSSIHVLFRDQTVRRVKEDEAAVLVSAGKASYISCTLYKAVQAGIPIDSIKDRRDDKAIKLQIQAISQKQPRKVEVQKNEPQEQRLSKAERRQRWLDANATPTEGNQ